MESQTLQFDLTADLKLFTIVFEAVSEKRNLLNDVIMDGFHLDTFDLQRTHPLLYSKIKMKMERKAKDYWDVVNQQITGIPSLDYYQAPSAKEKIIEAIKKTSLAN